MSKHLTYSADSREGRTLLALRTPMTSGELAERFPSGHQLSALLKAGLAEPCDAGWRLTDAGRAACPWRNPLAAKVTPRPPSPLARSAAPVGLPAKTAPHTSVRRSENPVHTGGIRMPNPARTPNPTAVDQVRRLLIAAPDGLARKDIIKRTGLADHGVDNAIINLIKAGEAVRKGYGVIAPVPAGLGAMAARLAQSEAVAAVAGDRERIVSETPPAALAEPLPIVVKAMKAQPDEADTPSANVDFAIYDDGRLAIADGDEIFVLPPDATRRLGQFLGRIEINGWPARL